MPNLLVKLIEHNNWANLQIIGACSVLTNEQLESTPLPTSSWSIRHTLVHLIESQGGYVSLLTSPLERKQAIPLTNSFAELRRSAEESGQALLTLVRDETDEYFATRIRTSDGYFVDLWVVVVQAINHATEHRRQVCRMLRIVGVSPPRLDGWTFGEVVDAVVPIPTETDTA